MTGRVVIGANFGDEGKGLFVDYLASGGGDVVVRFNGGCQAGHTVVTPSNQRHVFSHFGSGSFLGLPTFFSQHTIVNPVLFIKERMELLELGVSPTVYVHPDALVTTPWDMNANQDTERDRDQPHGSCGVGIFQTIQRDKKVRIRMRDLWDDITLFRDLVETSLELYNKDWDNVDRFIDDCEWFAHTVKPGFISDFSDPIFEGAQGLLLDQGNMEMYPHLTPSRCGAHNARELAYEGDIMIANTYYVSRPYMTRHGVGPLPGEDPSMSYPDLTNVNNEWQGELRFGHMDFDKLMARVHADSENPKIVFTHCDQEVVPIEARVVGSHHSFGPTRKDVSPSAYPLSYTIIAKYPKNRASAIK